MLGSHYPETRCVLSVKKAIFSELWLYKNNAFLGKDTVHFQTCMIWDKLVDILHSKSTRLKMDMLPFWFYNCVRAREKQRVCIQSRI